MDDKIRLIKGQEKEGCKMLVEGSQSKKVYRGDAIPKVFSCRLHID